MASILDFLSGGGQGDTGNGVLPDWLKMAMAGAQQPQQQQPYNPVAQDFSQFPNTQQPNPLSALFAQQGQGQPSGGGQQLPPMPPPINIPAAPQGGLPMSQPQQPMQQPQAPALASAGSPTPGIGDRLSAGLMGFANAGGPLPAIANLIGGLVTGQRTDPVGYQQQIMMATYKAALAGGATPAQAQMMAVSPELAQKFMPQLKEIRKDPFSGRIEYGAVNPMTAEVIGRRGGAGAPAADELPPQYNEQGRDEAFLKSLGPERAAGVKAITEGRLPATGRNLQQLMIDAARYEQGFDQNRFNARRTLTNDLNKSTPGSAGGQITFARTSLRHLNEVAKAADALDNVSFMGPDVSSWINWARAHKSSDQAAKVQALQDAALHYGQEVTKFYAGSPGGEAERQRFLTSLNGAKTPQELGTVIEQEKQLIPERLSELDNRIQSTLGPEAAKYPVHSEESRKAMDAISETTARMRGIAPTTATAPAAAPQQTLAPGKYKWTPQGLVPQ